MNAITKRAHGLGIAHIHREQVSRGRPPSAERVKRISAECVRKVKRDAQYQKLKRPVFFARIRPDLSWRLSDPIPEAHQHPRSARVARLNANESGFGRDQ